MGSGVVGLVMKGMLFEGELFNTSGNLLVLGGAVSPGSECPHKSEHQKYTVNTGRSQKNKPPQTTQMLSCGVRVLT